MRRSAVDKMQRFVKRSGRDARMLRLRRFRAAVSEFFQQFIRSPLQFIVGFLQSLTLGNALFRLLHKPLRSFQML